MKVQIMSGWGVDGTANISYTHQWNREFEDCGAMKFYGVDPLNVLDVGIDGNNEVILYIYPHNNKNDMEKLGKKFESQLLTICTSSIQDFVTIILDEHGPRAMTDRDFGTYFPQANKIDEMFIFVEQDSPLENPRILPLKQRLASGHDFLMFLATCSQCIAPVANQTTVFGELFTTLLVNSHSRRVKVPEGFDNVGKIYIPARKEMDFPEYLNVNRLTDILGKVDQNLVVSAGEAVENPVKLLPPPESEPQVREELDITVLPQRSQDAIIADILNKGSINCGDLFTWGVDEVLKMIGENEAPIQIFLDFPGVAEKMFIVGAKIYYKPLKHDQPDLADFFGTIYGDTFIEFEEPGFISD